MSAPTPIKVGDVVRSGAERGVVLRVAPRLFGSRGAHWGEEIYVDWSGATVKPEEVPS